MRAGVHRGTGKEWLAWQTARRRTSRGWIVTLAGLCINLALGVLYTWSIFTAKFTTVVTYGANGVVVKAGDAGAVAIKAG